MARKKSKTSPSKLKKKPTTRSKASTPKKKVSRTIPKTDERLRLALTSARMGIWEWDMLTNRVEWSAEVESMFGLRPGTFDNSYDSFLAAVHPDDRDHCQRVIKEYLSGKTHTYILQHRVVFKSGEVRWVEGRGEVYRDRNNKPLRMIGTVIDITETKRVEEVLRESESRLRQAQHLARLGIWDWSISTDRTNWSGAMFEIYGVPPEKFTGVGADYLKFTHPDDQEEQHNNIKTSFARAAESELTADRTRQARVVPREFRVIRPNGEIRFVLGDSWAVADEKGRPLRMFGTLVDVTDVKLTSQELKKTQHFVERIASTSPHIMYVYDIGERRSVWINRVFARELGYSEEEAREMSDDFTARLIHPDDMKKMGDFLARWETARDGVMMETEYRMKHASGQWRWFLSRDTVFQRNDAGDVTQVIGTSEDITERKKAEEALQESQKLTEKIAQASPFVLYIYDVSKQMVVWTNRHLAIDLGYSQKDITDMGAHLLPKIVHPEDIPKLIEYQKRQAFAADGEVMEGEYRIRHKDGSWRSILSRDAVFQRDETGRVRQVVGSAQDITERKRLEEQLLQSQKMESVGRLAGGVAHDFNNLLTAIIGFTDLCLKLEPDNPSGPVFLRNIQEAANRGARLTQQLLAFARKQVIELKPTDLNQLMRNCTELLNRLIGEDIEVSMIPRKSLWLVNADPHQLEQVLMNLALNARDAMPAGGILTLETANLSVEADFFEGAELPAGDYVHLSVRDTGHGISPELLKHIFEPFFTTKPQGKGTGLGLATCYGIIKQHHGHISVVSDQNNGTTFNVYLPRSQEKQAESEKTAPTTGIHKGRETILIVEDFDMLRSIAELVMKQQGYEVICASDGVDALNKARAFPGEIHLLVTDVVMPRMGGKELAKVLQAERPEIKILFSSGYTENAIANHGVLDPGIHFIQKPYKPMALASKARAILDDQS